jgi:hypothetical protein
MPQRRVGEERGKDGERGRLLSEIVKLNYVPNKVSRKNYYTIFRAALSERSLEWHPSGGRRKGPRAR